MEISKRLKVLASYVQSDNKVGDIGTDHGYLPIYLLESKRVSAIIASDLNQGPLDNAKSEIEKSDYLEQIDLRLGSGLDPYEPGEIDTIIIAGMGGNLIKQILEKGKSHHPYLNNLILQPMKGTIKLREWLLNNGYRIQDETLLKENNIFYEVIYAVKGESQEYTQKELELGFNLLKSGDDTSIEYITNKIKKIEAIVNEISEHGGSSSHRDLERLKSRLEFYREVKECLLTQEK